jgi:hypothetical protein
MPLPPNPFAASRERTAAKRGAGVPTFNMADPGFMAFHANMLASSGEMKGKDPERMRFTTGPFKGLTQAEAINTARAQWSKMPPAQRQQFGATPAAPAANPTPTLPLSPTPPPPAANRPPATAPTAPATPTESVMSQIMTPRAAGAGVLRPSAFSPTRPPGVIKDENGVVDLAASKEAGTIVNVPKTPTTPAPDPLMQQAQALQSAARTASAATMGPPVTAMGFKPRPTVPAPAPAVAAPAVAAPAAPATQPQPTAPAAAPTPTASPTAAIASFLPVLANRDRAAMAAAPKVNPVAGPTAPAPSAGVNPWDPATLKKSSNPAASMLGTVMAPTGPTAAKAMTGFRAKAGGYTPVPAMAPQKPAMAPVKKAAPAQDLYKLAGSFRPR